MAELDSFYFEKREPQKSCLLALRDIVLDQSPRLKECLKYGMPCFCLNKKAVCYLWTDKKTKEPYLLFVAGNRMNHEALEAGNRARMKIFRVSAYHDIPMETIRVLMKEALALAADSED